MVRDSKLSTCLAPDFLNFHTRGQLRQQERTLGPVNLEDALDFVRQRAWFFLFLANHILTRSVMTVLTQCAPVKGRLQSATTFGEPSLAMWLVATTILV